TIPPFAPRPPSDLLSRHLREHRGPGADGQVQKMLAVGRLVGHDLDPLLAHAPSWTTDTGVPFSVIRTASACGADVHERNCRHTRSCRSSSRIWPIGRSLSDCCGFSAARPPTRSAGRAIGNVGAGASRGTMRPTATPRLVSTNERPFAYRPEHAPGLIA